MNNQGIHEQVVQIIRQCTAPLARYGSVVLEGSFGRGEGTVLVGKDDALFPVNDIEVEVVTDTVVPHSELTSSKQRIKEATAADFVDVFTRSPNQLRFARLTMANYDVKHGSTVLWGDPHILDLMPDWKSTDVDMYEGLRLLLNRMAGCLGAFGTDRHLHHLGPLGVEQYRINQVVKLLIACGDVLVIARGWYHHLYRVRHFRFTEISGSYDLPKTFIDSICFAYRYKVSPDQTVGKQLLNLWPEIVLHVEILWLIALKSYLKIGDDETPSREELIRLFLGAWLHDDSILRTLRSRWTWKRRFGLPITRWPLANGIAVVFVFVAAVFLSSFRQSRAYAPFLPSASPNWSFNAKRAYDLWDDMIHGGDIEPW